jgi:hypothetical protein
MSKREEWFEPIVLPAQKTKRRAGVMPSRREDSDREKQKRRPERFKRLFDVLSLQAA